MNIRVAITSVGGGVGQSVVDSISHMKDSYWILGLDLNSDVYSYNQCDHFVRAKRIDVDGYLEFLVSTCLMHKIDVLISGNDNELTLLSENKSLFKDNGIKVIVAPAAIVKSSRDKYQWYKDYHNYFNIVPTVKLHEYVNEHSMYPEITFPAIAKPASGSASSGIHIFHNLEEVLQTYDDTFSDIYVIQPYLFPEKSDPEYQFLQNAVQKKQLLQVSEISAQIVLSNESKVLGVFVSKNKLKSGVPVHVAPVIDKNILKEVNDIALFLSKEKVVGPVNIQGRLTESGLIFFEMNLRFTGITGNRSLFGFNEVSALINDFYGLENHQNKLQINLDKVGVRQVACRTTSITNNSDVTRVIAFGGSSWFAKNFVYTLSKTDDAKQVELTLVARDFNGEQVNFFESVNRKFKRLTVLKLADIELTDQLQYSDVLINFTSARPPHGTDAIYDSTVFNLELAEKIKFSSIKLAINISSQSVYGHEKKTSYTEDCKPLISSSYALSKGIVEKAFENISYHNKNISIVNLRLSRLWGGNLSIDKNQLPFKILNNLLDSGSFNYQNPNNIMNFIDVNNASDAIIHLINKNISGTYNLGGFDITIKEFVDILGEILIENKVEFNEPEFVSNEKFNSFLAINSNKIKEIGYIPTSSIKDSWKRMIALYNENKLC
jgi:nucleoside-diphosphate-sugar epimerase